MKLGIIGYGTIAAAHASVLRPMPDVEVSVWGPDRARTRAFARRHDVVAVDRLRDHLRELDGVIVASPSSVHERQARAAIRAGVAVLVELPACGSVAAGRRLARLAAEHGVTLGATHTAVYLDPYRIVGEAIAKGQVGEVQRVTYRRDVPHRARTWADDALRHHAQHAIDLLCTWFGALTPTACHLTPATGPIAGCRASLLIPGGPRASIEVSYVATAPFSNLRVEGTAGWLETDRFTTVTRSRGPELRWDGDEAYHDAIRRQDHAFAVAVPTKAPTGDGWTTMLEATGLVDRLAAMATRGDG